MTGLFLSGLLLLKVACLNMCPEPITLVRSWSGLVMPLHAGHCLRSPLPYSPFAILDQEQFSITG